MRLSVFVLVLLFAFACQERAAPPTEGAPDAALRQTLTAVRAAIGKFQKDNKRYPHSLEELTPHYLRNVPLDPIAKAPFAVITEEPVVAADDFRGTADRGGASPAPASAVVIDVRSTATGADANGVRYSDY